MVSVKVSIRWSVKLSQLLFRARIDGIYCNTFVQVMLVFEYLLLQVLHVVILRYTTSMNSTVLIPLGISDFIISFSYCTPSVWDLKIYDVFCF